ncbi:MAG: 3-carboxy-cis,cis-muconate cycloisomerase [Rhodocyclaceae bacterium]
MGNTLLGALFGTPAAQALFSDVGWLRRMLDVEAALARAQGRVGVIPAAAVEPIVAACAEAPDVDAIAQGAALAGNPAIPLVKALTRRVADVDPHAAGYVHWGATSQDILDSAQMLQVREALALLDADLARAAHACMALIERHRATPMVARTWLQQALPTRFGVKVAGWLSAITRQRAHIVRLRRDTLALQLGGAVGTLASLGAQGPAVARALGEELGLPVGDPWHTQRDRIAEIGAVAGLVVGGLGKIARDVALLMQTEVGEVSEAAVAGKGGSSTMPHKRNPVDSAAILAAAARAPALVATLFTGLVQEHERALGAWQQEWATLPELLSLALGAAAHGADLLGGLSVDTERMRANLDLTHGAVMAEAVSMALGETLGRHTAHELVEQAVRRATKEQRALREVLSEEPRVRDELDDHQLAALFDPLRYTGMAESLIEAALREAQAQDKES